MTKRIALITGATSGIGLETARLFAQNGMKLIITGRRKDRLQVVAEELALLTQIHTLCFDVSDKEATQIALSQLPPDFKEIDILINNAGNAYGMDGADSAKLSDWEKMIDINVKGLLYVTHFVTEGMIQRNRGHIINLGSIAAKEVYPKGSVYCASKHAVDAFTRGLRQDLNPYGIKVAAIHPGLVETEFSLIRFEGDAEKAKKVYEGMEPLRGRDIAEAMLFMVTRAPHVNIADLLILPTAQASASLVKRKS